MAEEWAETAEAPPENLTGGMNMTSRPIHQRSMVQSSQPGHNNVSGPYNNMPKTTSATEKQATLYHGSDNMNTNSHNRLKPPFWKLTVAECLYFWCDEKFHARHRCTNKELTLLVVHEDGSECEWDEDSEEVVEEYVQEVSEMAELSLNLLVGISSPRTMKLMGIIRAEQLVVMIDSGVTHNFISKMWCSVWS